MASLTFSVVSLTAPHVCSMPSATAPAALNAVSVVFLAPFLSQSSPICKAEVRCFVPVVMGLTNFILTVAGVGAILLLARTDIKQSASTFKRNASQIRKWLEDESVAASRSAKKGKPKELEKPNDKKDHHKEDN